MRNFIYVQHPNDVKPYDSPNYVNGSKPSYQILALGELWKFEPGKYNEPYDIVTLNLGDAKELLQQPLDGKNLWNRCQTVFVRRKRKDALAPDALQQVEISRLINAAKNSLEEITAAR